MKAVNYTVTLVFRSEDGEFVPSPTSSCGCPHGTFFCSHMLGKLLLFSMIQYRVDLTFDDLKLHLPPPLRASGNRCVPVMFHWRFPELSTMVEAEEPDALDP
ncbi:hypothetical protein B484DRAFT_408277 [Ochromonadaceae sp. CCMP2298]|nr:hypothetical protein B484DRAFT_408277 [Ochromonadaceae sp. CCMP2298]